MKKALKSNDFKAFHLAGAEGFEPSTKVLETHVLPLHQAPTATFRNVTQLGVNVKFKNQHVIY